MIARMRKFCSADDPFNSPVTPSIPPQLVDPFHDETTSTLQQHPIDIGHSIDNLIAAIPALLGFRPTESLVFIGMVPVKNRHGGKGGEQAFRIGPIVRTDLDATAVAEGLETLNNALDGAPEAEVLSLSLIHI